MFFILHNDSALDRTEQNDSADEDLSSRYRERLRDLARDYRWCENYLREEAAPGERAAFEAAIGVGLIYLRRYRTVPELLDHLWDDPKFVAPAPGVPLARWPVQAHGVAN